MQEIWKNFKGYEGIYKVSNFGRVKSLDRVVKCNGRFNRNHKGKVLKGEMVVRYCRVGLSKNGKVKNKMIHRLVAEAFIHKIEGKPFVNHIDGNRSNNCVDNLEWCTQKENIHHAYRMNLIHNVRGEEHGMHKISEKDVKVIRYLYKNNFCNQNELCEIFNVDCSMIGYIVNRKNWKHVEDI